MKTIEKKQKVDLAQELKNKVYDFVNSRFNFIQVDVLNKCCDDELYAFIRQVDVTFENIAEFTGENLRMIKRKYATPELHPSYQEVMDHENGGDKNYPMWNTCFEFRDGAAEGMIQAAIKAGFGVIEGMDDFNELLFVAGCGYSFYGAHWIPMYLAYYEDEAKKYKGVDYGQF